MIIWKWFITAIKYLTIAALVVVGARLAYIELTTFNKNYYCVGKEKVFFPTIYNMKYVAFDAPDPTETHEIKFVLNIEHTTRWFQDEYVWFQGNAIFESKKRKGFPETIAFYNRAIKTYVGRNLDDSNNTSSAEFSPISKKFVSAQTFYDHGGAAYQTKLRADIFKAVEAQCSPY